MTNIRRSLAGLLLLGPLTLTGCFHWIDLYDPSDPNHYPTVTVTPQIQTLAAGASQTFSATTSSTTGELTWVINNSNFASDAGSLSTTNSRASNIADGPTVIYTAPATPPIWSDSLITPGTVTLRISSGFTSIDRDIIITAPSIAVGIHNPSTTTVKLGGTLVLNAYAVGSVSNGLNLQVNGTSGGSTAFGFIAPIGGIYGQYQYSAPTSMPMTGSAVNITAISTADPTKTANLTLTLQ